MIPDNGMNAPRPRMAAIGFFDGVHLGHRYLIEQVGREAAARGYAPALVTFPTHPRKVINAGYTPELLTSCDEKIRLLEAAGAGCCLLLEFTPDMSRLTAYDFMRSVLKERYAIRGLVVGHDHRFGRNRSEGFDDYLLYGRELGIEVIRAQALVTNGVTVSSSGIRRLLHAGDVALAARYLGYEYALEGTVTGGYRVGRTIGFPTANLQPDDPDKLIPADGVYAVRVTVGGAVYAGMMNIGRRPTLHNGCDRSLEVHILRFRADIYGCPIRIAFAGRIRSEKKFADKAQLAEQLAEDALAASKLLLSL
ncbi:MAG: riboflavin biosynthesis protein RibF [Mediterranea sp.]|jgi:riboflavin kinase/FMN adenylyltransferase|nr:riboflavin biosynthesis protein RibF [Mediterranea sp.]